MRMHRFPVLLLLAASLFPQAAAAQQEPPRAWRAIVFSVAGAGILASAAQFAREGHEGAFCSDRTCLTAVGVSVGGFVGFLLGSDLDERARSRWVPAPRLEVPYRSLEVLGVQRLSPLPGGVAALTTTGVSVLEGEQAPRRLADVTRPRDIALLPGSSLFAVAAEPGLLALRLAGETVDTLLQETVSAVAAVEPGILVLGTRGALRRARVFEAAGGPELRMEAEQTVPYVTPSVQRGRDGIWILADTVLELREAGTLALTRAVPLGAYSSDLALGEGVALVALGTAGVAVVDIRNPVSSRVVATLTDMTRADAVAVAGREAYVAAGAQGIFVYDLSDPVAPRLAGVRPGLGLAVDVSVSDGALWVLDRRGGRVLRIEGAGALAPGR